MENKINYGQGLFLLITTITIVLGGVLVVEAPTTIILITAGTVAIIFSLIWGIEWETIREDIFENLKAMFPAILILLSVGMLVGAWMLSGTVPIMIYYGLKILTPSTLLVMSAIICALMSIMAGTSWGTISTVGIALMGVSAGLGVPAHYTAGAIVVGAIFGDKLSPLSDTTVLASAVSKVDIIDHIKQMLYTTLPSFIISLIVFTVLGLRYSGGTIEGGEMTLILETLETTFNLNILLILPPIVVLFLIYKGFSTIPVFGIGIILGGIFAGIFQGEGLLAISNALMDGYSTSTNVDIVDNMLLRGGLSSMLGTVALLIGAGIFGSPLRTAGVIDLILDKMKKVSSSSRDIGLFTFVVHSIFFIITGSYYVTFTVLGPMVKPLYNEYDLSGTNLSRTLEATGTALAPIIPWSVTGAFIASTLGVPTRQYFLYAPLTYLAPIFLLIYIITGYSVVKMKSSEKEKQAS